MTTETLIDRLQRLTRSGLYSPDKHVELRITVEGKEFMLSEVKAEFSNYEQSRCHNGQVY